MCAGDSLPGMADLCMTGDTAVHHIDACLTIACTSVIRHCSNRYSVTATPPHLAVPAVADIRRRQRTRRVIIEQ